MDGPRIRPAVVGAAIAGLVCGGVVQAKPAPPHVTVPHGPPAPAKPTQTHTPPLPKVKPGHVDVTKHIVKPTAKGPVPGFTPTISGLSPFGSGPHHGHQPGPKVRRLVVPKAPRKGRKTTFTISAKDATAPITGASFDFGEAGGRYGESQCKLGARGGHGHAHAAAHKPHHSTFALPYAFTTPGPHNVRFELTSGGCGKRTAVTAGQVTVNVADAGAARSFRGITGPLAGVLSTNCPGADLVPASPTRTAARIATACLINEVRAKAGLRSLATLRILRRIAAGHSRDMVDRHYFDHTEPSGATLASRLRSVGWNGPAGENIGYGTFFFASPRSMMWLWMHSSGHRANILDPDWRYVGVAIALGAPTETGNPAATYTVDFAGR